MTLGPVVNAGEAGIRSRVDMIDKFDRLSSEARLIRRGVVCIGGVLKHHRAVVDPAAYGHLSLSL